MGTATITFKDKGKEGEVSVSIEFDPSVSPEDDVATPAQRYALYVLSLAQQDVEEEADA